MYVKPDNKNDFTAIIDWRGRRYEPKGNSDGFEVMCYTQRHGRKPSAVRSKIVNNGWDLDLKRISKCWKDQSKRRNQYKPVLMY